MNYCEYKELERLAKNNNPWVSVIERPPDDGREVLICTRSGRRYVAAWRDDAQWWDSYDYGWIDSDEIITHWCELPELPEVVE